MAPKAKKALYTGPLHIGDIEISAAVLDDDERTRVLSERETVRALGGRRGGSHWLRRKGRGEGADLPVFASAQNLQPFVSNELKEKLRNRIEYHTGRGGRPAFGVRADVLPEICDVWLKARDADALHPTQVHIAKQAEILMRGLAHVGIIALVDEATGYQEERNRTELQAILEAYIAEEFRGWTKQFPDEFYKEMFRLYGWSYSPLSVKRPGYVGKLTNKLVYEKLPPGVLNELRKKNPVNPSTKRRSRKHHQFLTEDIGNPHLRSHLAAVVALMRAAPNLAAFNRMFARAFPDNEQLELDVDEEDAA
jgi:hypothetical protein